MKRLIFIYIISIIVPFAAICQSVINNDTINKVDAKGKKQGYWKKYVNDTLKYEGVFKDDKPLGEFKYYYGNGKLKATSVYSNSGISCFTIMYNLNGKKEAEGFYTNTKKDSVWKYYGENDTLIAEEHYKATKKHGVWKSYYKNGVINEEIPYMYGYGNGTWKRYFSDGKIKSEGKIDNSRREGLYKFYYPDGNIYILGEYKNDFKDGLWIQYDEKSISILKEETYKDGVLLKSEEFNPPKNPLK